jgi:GDP-4-dehydro-6-deoxy-D-mannose reductase
MRCLITGATGFVGAHLTELLLARGDEVYGACWPEPVPESRPGVNLRLCNITDAAGLLGFVREAQPDQVYHLAGLSSPLDSLAHQRASYETNFFGALNLLDAVRQAAPKARVLLVGSSQCYGAPKAAALPITEQQPFAPLNPYAVSKAAADLLGFQFFSAYGVHVLRARPANHTGPGQPPSFVCSDFARQVAAIELGMAPAELRVGNIEVRRDFSDVRDVVRAYVALVERGRSGEAYNVGSGRSITLKEIVETLTGFCSRPIQVIIDSHRMRSNDAKELYVSTAKITADTGWASQYPLGVTLRDLYDYWVSALKSEPGGSPVKNTTSCWIIR